MSISVNCDACGKVYSLKPEAAGQSFVCQACGGQVVVPGGNPQPIDDTDSQVGNSTSSGGGAQSGSSGGGRGRIVSNSGQQAALARVKWPAILMMITAGISCLAQPLVILIESFGFAALGSEGEMEEWVAWASGGGGLVYFGSCLISSIIVLVGAWKMKNLRGYGFSVTAMVFGILPCMSICCSFSFFIGIWGLVVLNNADVKAAFRSARG